MASARDPRFAGDTKPTYAKPSVTKAHADSWQPVLRRTRRRGDRSGPSLSAGGGETRVEEASSHSCELPWYVEEAFPRRAPRDERAEHARGRRRAEDVRVHRLPARLVDLLRLFHTINCYYYTVSGGMEDDDDDDLPSDVDKYGLA